MSHDIWYVGQCFDVVDHRRLAPEALLDRKRRLGPRHPPLSLDRSDQGCFLAADKSACPELELDVEIKTRIQHVSAEKPSLLRLLQRQPQPFDGQRILRPDIHIPPAGTDHIGTNQHALDYGMGISLDDRTVHERAGISLVGVADNIFDVAQCIPRHLPLEPRRKACAAPSLQPRLFDHFVRVQGAHGRQHGASRFVAAPGSVRFDVFRVYFTAVGKHDLDLLAVETMIVVLDQPLLDWVAAHDMLLDDPPHHVRPDVLVRGLGSVPDYVDEYVAGAEPAAADLVHGTVFLNRCLNSRGRDCLLKGALDLNAAGCDPAGAHADFYRNTVIHGAVAFCPMPPLRLPRAA